jgi:ribonuclease D
VRGAARRRSVQAAAKLGLGADKLTDQQKHYAASDVLHLHALKAKLDAMLQREGRLTEAEACFRFLGVRAGLDLAGFDDMDIFAH